MIFVVHVQSGMEHDVVSSLREKKILACSPTHDLLERKKGMWHTVRRLIFPGYVFIIADSISDDMYYTVRNINGVVRFLGRPPTPLPMSEQHRLIWILETENLTVSKGYIKDGRVTVTDGILTGREHCILKYSKRRKRCTLYCEINGKRHYFDVSAELDKI
jgi:transcriptional antiterminator NusG